MNRRGFIGTITLAIPALCIAPELLISKPKNTFINTIIDPVTGMPFECCMVYNPDLAEWKITLKLKTT